MELLLKFHWGVCVGRAEDCMLEESFLEDEIFSRGLFPLMGDWRLVSELEDLDLLTGKKERLLGVEVFEDSFSLAAALQERGSRETCWEEFPKPSPSSASSLHWLLYLAALSTAFLARIVVFPRSADRRVSFCRSALLKNESPLSSDLLLRRRSLEETLGERRLVTEELLLELLTGLLSGRLTSAVLGWDVRGVALTLDFSARGLVCTKSLLEPLSTSFFLPDTEFLSEELFLEVGEGEAEDWGVEVRDSFPFVPPDTGDSCACKDFSFWRVFLKVYHWYFWENRSSLLNWSLWCPLLEGWKTLGRMETWWQKRCSGASWRASLGPPWFWWSSSCWSSSHLLSSPTRSSYASAL